MNSSINKVLKNSALFSICVIASKALGFILLPLYTRYLSGDAYGVANTVISFTSSFDIVVMLALREALLRYYNSYSEEERPRFIGTVVCTIMVNGLFVTLTLIVTHGVWSDWLLKGINFYPIVFCGVLTLLFETIYITYQSVLQSRQDGRSYSINGILYGLVQAAMNVLFLVVFNLGALGVVLGALVANAFFAVYGLVRMLKKNYMIICFYPSMCVKALKYSIPFIPHNLSSTIANFISKIVLNSAVSYAATGLYTVSIQISTIMAMVQQSLNLAFRPWFNEQMQLGFEGRRNIKIFSGLMFSANAFVCIGVSLFSREIISLFTAPEYHDAWQVVPILTIALVVEFVYYMHILTIMYDIRASRLIAVCSTTGALANIILAFFLIPAIQSYGAALAVLLAKTVMSIITVLYSRKVCHVDFGLGSMVIKTCFTLIIIAAGYLITDLHGPDNIDLASITGKIMLLLVAMLVLFYRQRRECIALIQSVLKRIF